MISKVEMDLAANTFDRTLERLKSLGSLSLKKPSSDPEDFSKGGSRIAKIRVLPNRKDSAPLQFWSSKNCFYEIGVGVYRGRANCLGAVQFMMYPNYKACGNGRYTAGVREILSKLQPASKENFFLHFMVPPIEDAILCGFQYSVNPGQTTFPVEQAAQDLAWLIQETLPKFQVLS